MTIGSRRPLPAALTGCLGLLVVAVTACLWPQTWHPQADGTVGGSAVRARLMGTTAPGWSADDDPAGSGPALLPPRAQELAPAILTHGGAILTHGAAILRHGGAADGSHTWWGAACLLLLCTTVASGPRGLRPRVAVHRHGTRAPPFRS